MCDVPALRFPEFTGEWKRIRVSDLLDFYSTNSLSWEQLEYESNEPYNLHYGLIHVGLPTLVDLVKDKLPSIKEGNVPKNMNFVRRAMLLLQTHRKIQMKLLRLLNFTI